MAIGSAMTLADLAATSAARRYLTLLGRSDVSELFVGNRVLERFPRFPQTTIELGPNKKPHQVGVTSNEMVAVVRHATRLWDARGR